MHTYNDIMPVADLPITATLTRQGKTATLVFDAELAEALGVEPGGQVRMTRLGKQIIIEAAPPSPTDADRKAQFQIAMRETAHENAELFRRLAK
jgi:hypothetical protein